MSLFLFTCSLPPTENHLHRSTRGGTRYATTQYKDWIREESQNLMLALRAAGIREPDVARWWSSHATVFVDARHDSDSATAYTKAVHDLLSGSYVDKKTGRILKAGAFWDDDKRVRRVDWSLEDVESDQPRVMLALALAHPPRNWPRQGTRAKSTQGRGT